MALTEYYVDPSIAADSGAGTSGSPWGDLQYALNQATRDTTDGTIFHIKAGTAESLTGALSLTTFGAPDENYPLIFEGYTTTAGDGGIGAIDCNGNTLITNSGEGIVWRNLEIFDGPTGSSNMVELVSYGGIVNCYLHDVLGRAISTSGSNTFVIGCRFEQCGDGVNDPVIRLGNTRSQILFNYLTDLGNASYQPESFIEILTTGVACVGNIIHIYSTSSASDGIFVSGSGSFAHTIAHNTILCEGGTGTGIVGDSNRQALNIAYINNYVEGFSGTGGYAYDLNNGGFGSAVFIGNRYFNCLNDHRLASVSSYPYTAADGFEKLVATGIEKSGAKTYANRFTFFETKASGNMIDAWPESGSI